MSHEVVITVRAVPDEHVAYATRLALVLSRAFTLEQNGCWIDLSVEKDHDGVERVYEFLTFEDGDWKNREEATDRAGQDDTST